MLVDLKLFLAGAAVSKQRQVIGLNVEALLPFDFGEQLLDCVMADL
jgi:hypothetical protein